MRWLNNSVAKSESLQAKELKDPVKEMQKKLMKIENELKQKLIDQNNDVFDPNFYENANFDPDKLKQLLLLNKLKAKIMRNKYIPDDVHEESVSSPDEESEP